jgi:hypothetical protein
VIAGNRRTRPSTSRFSGLRRALGPYSARDAGVMMKQVSRIVEIGMPFGLAPCPFNERVQSSDQPHLVYGQYTRLQTTGRTISPGELRP